MTHSAVGMWKWLFPEWQKLRRSLSPEIWVCWELINETAAFNAWKYEVFHSTIKSTNIYRASAMCWVTLSSFCTHPAILPHFLTVTEMKSSSVPRKANTFPQSSGSRPFLLHQTSFFRMFSQSDLSHQQVSSLYHLLPSGYLPSISTLFVVNWLQRVGHICCLTSFSSVQLLSHVWLFATPWTTARQASLSITNSRNLLKLMSIKSVMPTNHLILCCPLLLLPSIIPSIRIFSSEWILCIRWTKYWSFSHQSFQWIFRTDLL